MQTTFLIFAGYEYESSSLLGGRENAHAAVDAAQALARNSVTGQYPRYDFIRVVEVPAGNWGANPDGQTEGRGVWHWHRPYEPSRPLKFPALEIDVYPGSQAGAKAIRHTRTRGPMDVIVTEPVIDDSVLAYVPDHLWYGQWIN